MHYIARVSASSVTKIFRKKFKFIITTCIMLVKKNKKWKLIEKIKFDFEINFENVEIDYTKHKILQLFTKIFKIKLDNKFYHSDLS